MNTPPRTGPRLRGNLLARASADGADRAETAAGPGRIWNMISGAGFRSPKAEARAALAKCRYATLNEAGMARGRELVAKKPAQAQKEANESPEPAEPAFSPTDY
jgi:hypothetical protein